MPAPRYKGVTAAEALAAAAVFERAMGRSGQSEPLRLLAPWIVRESELGSRWLAWRNALVMELGGRPERGLAWLKKAVRSTGECLDPSLHFEGAMAADRLRIGNHLTAVYLGASPQCAKLAVRDPDPEDAAERLAAAASPGEGHAPRAAALARELALREAVAGEIRVPHTVAHDLAASVPYLVDRLEPGNNPLRRHERLHVARVVSDGLCRLHQAHGLRGTLPAAFLGAEAVASIAEGLELAGLPADPPWHGSALRLLQEDRQVACALGHGDLNRGNLLVDEQGTVTVLDWEAGGLQPVGRDLEALMKLAPEARGQWLATWDRELDPSGYLPARDQVGVVLVERLARWRPLQERMERRGYRDASARTVRSIRRTAEALSSLYAP